MGFALNSGSAQWAFTGFCLQNSKNGEGLVTKDGSEYENIYKKQREFNKSLTDWLLVAPSLLFMHLDSSYETLLTENGVNIAKVKY